MFSQITDYQNLLTAYYLTRRSRRYQPEFQKIEMRYELLLSQLQWKLKNGFYHPKPYHQFLVCEPKKRQVSAPHLYDRIVHHAIINIINPTFESIFIPHSYACRKYKGALVNKNELVESYQQIYQKNPKFYAYKSDIKSYFKKINHSILFQLLQQHLTCPQTLNLLKIIIDSYHETPDTGIPIGNLTSQLFANLYLHPLDTFVTQTIGQSNYFRYMDDFVILSPDKEYLINLRCLIAGFLKHFLKLELHPRKNNIFRADFGLDFVGFLIKPDSVTLRKKTLRRHQRHFKRRLKLIKKFKDRQDLEKVASIQTKIKSSGYSFRGFLKNTDFQENSRSYKINGITISKEF